MLTTEENDRLSRVGAGTPMGELMRRYWHPIAPVSMLDEDPVRKVKILGEELVLYRDRSGKLGLIGPRCAHRLVHMEHGIPEENGLRCPYHGWCYDETGQCTETPLESPNSKLRNNIKIPGYPVQEMGGLVFAYLGPLPAPILPPWDFLVWPNTLRQVGLTILPCNWLQCHENSADPFHTKFLHGDWFLYQLEKMGALDDRASDQDSHRAHNFKRFLVGHDGMWFKREKYGFRKGINLSKAKGASADESQPHAFNIFPYYSRGGQGGIRNFINIRVPMDDTQTLHITYFIYHAPYVDAPEQSSIPYFNVPLYNEDGKLILDYTAAQDFAAWHSQGELTDRTQEHLAATDLGVIEFRKLLSDQIDIVEAGNDPMNVFRDPSEVGNCIQLAPAIGEDVWIPNVRRRSTDYFHEGYWQDELDRFGPATPLACDLMRRAAEHREKNAELQEGAVLA